MRERAASFELIADRLAGTSCAVFRYVGGLSWSSGR
jgi:hypothetical protein